MKSRKCLSTICNQNSRENLLLNIEILENPEEEVSDIIQYGEYRWIRFRESFMSVWKKWQDLKSVDPRKHNGSCVEFDANSKWIVTCQKDYQLVSWYSAKKILNDYLQDIKLQCKQVLTIKVGISFADRQRNRSNR